MKISTKIRYGARAMLELASHYGEGPIEFKEIAKRENISLKYLEQVINSLRAAGLVKSIRGAKGGYSLAKPPSEICLYDVYAPNIAEVIQELGVAPSSLKLRVGIFGAEPWSEAMRGEIERKLNLQALDIYGLSEVMGPGVAMKCLEKRGPHVFEDHFLAEVIDPDTGEVLPPGARGELVFTSLTKDAFPVIRYRTRDITSLDTAPCSCGRTLARMVRVTGRTDDMLIIRGVNVFPSQIESILVGIPGVLLFGFLLG